MKDRNFASLAELERNTTRDGHSARTAAPLHASEWFGLVLSFHGSDQELLGGLLGFFWQGLHFNYSEPLSFAATPLRPSMADKPMGYLLGHFSRFDVGRLGATLTLPPPTPIFLSGSGILRMSSTPFGEHLKREREMRGVSLEEISAATRISTRFLEAIEGEHWDQLPGGVLNRGFIRALARFLGLDEDSLVAEYALGTGSQVNAAPATEQSWNTSRNWLPFAAAIIVTLLIVAGGVATWHFYGSRI